MLQDSYIGLEPVEASLKCMVDHQDFDKKY